MLWITYLLCYYLGLQFTRTIQNTLKYNFSLAGLEQALVNVDVLHKGRDGANADTPWPLAFTWWTGTTAEATNFSRINSTTSRRHYGITSSNNMHIRSSSGTPDRDV